MKLTTGSFIKYLTAERPGFFDGLRSTYCVDALNSGSLGNGFYSALCFAPTPNWYLTSVQYYIAHPVSDAISGTPHDPLLVFFTPSSILYPSIGRNLGNESLIFHEALHGITGKDDGPMLQTFGWSLTAASCNISRYIETSVLSKSPGLDSTSTTPTCCDPHVKLCK